MTIPAIRVTIERASSSKSRGASQRVGASNQNATSTCGKALEMVAKITGKEEGASSGPRSALVIPMPLTQGDTQLRLVVATLRQPFKRGSVIW